MKNPLRNYLTENEQKILLFLIIAAFIGMSFRFTGLLAEVEPESADSLNIEQDHQIKYSLHSVTAEELTTISGIGKKRASDIINYRNEFGFHRKEDLKNVKGIGDKTFEKIKCYFYDFNEQSKKEPSQSEQHIVQKENTAQAKHTEKININTANKIELMKLKGVGSKKAQLIIECRSKMGKFTSLDDLLEVKGIGPKTLENLKRSITLGD